MRTFADNLILILGIGGALALLFGCLVVAGYLVCAGLPWRSPPKNRRPEISVRLDLFPW